jgi:hypothetical protein
MEIAQAHEGKGAIAPLDQARDQGEEGGEQAFLGKRGLQLKG